ncbi:alpha/beta hydrolase, partial [Actinomadura sp. KC345]
MPLHPQTVSFLEVLSSWTAAPPDAGGRAEPTIEEMRARTGAALPAAARRELPLVRDLAVRGPDGPVPVRLYRPAPPERGPLPALVYLHGG